MRIENANVAWMPAGATRAASFEGTVQIESYGVILGPAFRGQYGPPSTTRRSIIPWNRVIEVWYDHKP